MGDSVEYMDGLRVIARKRRYAYMPLIMSFLAVVAYIYQGGSEVKMLYIIMLPGFLLHLLWLGIHFLITECPRCAGKFYSRWAILGFFKHRVPRCHQCDLGVEN